MISVRHKLPRWRVLINSLHPLEIPEQSESFEYLPCSFHLGSWSLRRAMVIFIRLTYPALAFYATAEPVNIRSRVRGLLSLPGSSPSRALPPLSFLPVMRGVRHVVREIPFPSRADGSGD